ncbi:MULTISPECIES: DUF1294 domain-containing protein [unclassified Pseudoalteromonas]|uniref:DUF1294 domain-containing protein n=1 Tax=unclassified Pseudoalteromonas TaxID=194690 RepID=UPI00301526FB
MSAVRLVQNQSGLFWGLSVWLGIVCLSKLPWPPLYTAVGLLILNLLTFAVMWWDKRKATMAADRVSELRLLILALLGLNIITPVAMYLLRHKTQKPSFNYKLFMVLLLQTLLSGSLFLLLFF